MKIQFFRLATGAVSAVCVATLLTVTTPSMVSAGDILDRKGDDAETKGDILRAKLKARMARQKAGQGAGDGVIVGECGVNIGNQINNKRSAGNTKITVVVEKPIVNMGNCK